ncbi:MAG TPA: MFS transporter [Candidatus Acidoferrum sp.]|nr:MFS transporter [Candidatus Acidoferrum sp.]
MPTVMASPRASLPVSLWIVVVLMGFSAFLNYLDRGNLSIAAPMLKEELHISPVQLGFLLSAFFWTYGSFQLFSGWLVDRLNVNLVFAAGFFLWSAATAATGVVHTFAALFLLRFILGIGESVAFPSYAKIISLNYPPARRGIANSAVAAGLVLGPGFGMLFGGLLMARFGWRSFFVLLGLLSLLWLLPWLTFMPKKHHAIALDHDSAAAPNLLEFLAMRSAWGTCLSLFCSNYLNYFLITWLPFYLVRERNFSLDTMAKIGGLAYLLGACFSLLAGWLSDRWIVWGATATLARKTVSGGGLAAAGLFVGLAVVGGPRFSVAALTLGVVFFGVTASNTWAITQTLAGPKAAGRWTGFQCFAGNLSGIVAPAATGYVLERTGHFFWAFMIVTAVAWLGAVATFFLIGPIKQVTWRQKSLSSSYGGVSNVGAGL